MELRNPSNSARERGMAHVSIFWMLVPMVLMLAALFYAYDRHTSLLVAQQAEAQAKKETLAKQDQVNARDELLTELTKLIGQKGTFTYDKLDTGDKITLSDYSAPAPINTLFDTQKQVLNLPKTLSTMSDIIDEMRTKLGERDTRITNLENELSGARSAKSTAETNLASVRTDKDSEIDRLNSEKLAEQRKLERNVESYEGQLSSERDRTRRANEEKRQAEDVAQTKIKGMQKEIDIRNARLQAATDRDRLRNSPEAPDGEVLAADDRTNLAWINRGSRDLIKKGLTFRVLERRKGQLYRKASAVVTRVLDDRSEVRIVNLLDPLDPVVRGDVIANDLYSPNLKRNVFLIGRFVTPLTKDEIRKKLESMGNTVHDKYSPAVDLVIVGREALGEDATKIQDMPDYQEAKKLNVEIRPLHSVRDFLRL